jgi:hypothetical protein
MDSQSIVADARNHLSVWRALPYPSQIVPSQVWHDHIAAHLLPIQSLSPEELVERVTSNNITSEPTATDNPIFTKVLAAQQRWLERFGRPLNSFPSYIQESELASPKVVTMAGNRLLSTAFLYFLSIATQIQSAVKKIDFVMELGSGYGGTARVLKLLSPRTKLVLCDLPETLYLCYVFMRRHFPHSSFEVLHQGAKLPEPERAADFTFVPAQLADQLAGSTFDLVLNTCSLSEMTQAACDWYLHLIQNRFSTDYFFHLNRIGTPEDLRNCCATSYGLDRDWEVLNWQWRGDDNFYNASFPNYTWLLNLMVRRIPECIRSEMLYSSMQRSLRSRLARAEKGSDEWHAAMWGLIRLEGQSGDIQAYLNVMRPLRWREVEYYEALLRSKRAV